MSKNSNLESMMDELKHLSKKKKKGKNKEKKDKKDTKDTKDQKFNPHCHAGFQLSKHDLLLCLQEEDKELLTLVQDRMQDFTRIAIHYTHGSNDTWDKYKRPQGYRWQNKNRVQYVKQWYQKQTESIMYFQEYYLHQTKRGVTFSLVGNIKGEFFILHVIHEGKATNFRARKDILKGQMGTKRSFGHRFGVPVIPYIQT